MILRWDEKLSVGVTELDDKHKELLGIMNEVLAGVDSKDDRAEALASLDRLISEVDDHITLEEALLKDCHDSDESSYSLENMLLMSDLIDFSADFRSNSYQHSVEVGNFFNGWIKGHIQNNRLAQSKKTEERAVG